MTMHVYMEYSSWKAPDMGRINLKPWFEPIINSMGGEGGDKKVNLEEERQSAENLTHIATFMEKKT